MRHLLINLINALVIESTSQFEPTQQRPALDFKTVSPKLPGKPEKLFYIFIILLTFIPVRSIIFISLFRIA